MRLLATAVLLAAGLGVPTAVPNAAADEWSLPAKSHELPTTTFVDMVVDDAHGHLYLSDGGGAGVLVRDLDGNAIRSIPNMPGARGMALSLDGSTLYVALSHGDAIAAIDTVTLLEKARYLTGPGSCPDSIAVTATQLWFGHGCIGDFGGIGVVDLTTLPPTVVLDTEPAAAAYLHFPQLRISPAAPDRIVVTEYGLSPGRLWSFGITGTTLAMLATRETTANISAITLTPDGEHAVVSAEGSSHLALRFRVSDLSESGGYGAHLYYPNSVAVSGGGFVAAGLNAYSGLDVFVFTEGGAEVRAYELGEVLDRGGIEFSSDGSRMYAVTGYSSEDKRTLHVLNEPTRAKTSITLSAPVTAQVDTAFRLTGTLTWPTTVPVGTVVHVSRTHDGETEQLPDVETGVNNAFELDDTVPEQGTYTYTVRYDGDDVREPATAQDTVDVAPRTPALTITTNATAYRYGQVESIVAHLGPTASDRTLRIYATPRDRPALLIREGTVNSNGDLAATHRMTTATTFTVSFGGDEGYRPASASKSVTSSVRVTQRQSGYDTTSAGYAYYRTSVDPTLNVSVAPNRRRACMTFEAQIHSRGAWRTVQRDTCVRLDTNSRIAPKMTATPRAGYRYRMRATFNGDTWNTRTYGTWRYFAFR